MTSPASTIVVGLDGSPESARALRWATARAGETGTPIVAVHVLTYSAEFNRDVSPDTITTWRRQLHERLDHEWTDGARAQGVTVHTAVIEDDNAANGLLRAAEEHRAELIVLGVHGHEGLADRILHATTYHVTHRAHQPVVVVPADSPERP